MDLKEILKANPILTLKGLQAFQEEYDRRFVAGKGFVGDEKVKHTYAHMGKLFGKLATYVEAIEEGREVSNEDIRTKVIPDLLVYSAWLAEVFGVDMEESYLTRVTGNLRRLYSDKVSPQELDELDDCVRKRVE